VGALYLFLAGVLPDQGINPLEIQDRHRGLPLQVIR
jgi:hypothetical protein